MGRILLKIRAGSDAQQKTAALVKIEMVKTALLLVISTCLLFDWVRKEYGLSNSAESLLDIMFTLILNKL